jgi:D-aspartate ligase
MAGGDTPPVVILGGAVNALSAARSLGRRGIRVHALAESARIQAIRWSRHTSEYVPFPGGSAQAGWREWLARGPEGAVILPSSDNGLEFVARNRAFLRGLGHHPVEANDELLLAMLDKGATYRVATAAGIDAPRAVHIWSVEELQTHRLKLPCVVKPTSAHRRSRGFRNRKALLVQDQCELERTVRATTDGDSGVVVMEVVPGPDAAFCSYYTYLVDGEPVFHYTKRKLRQYPIHFGDGSYHVSDDVPEARELGLRLFRAAGLVGLGNVEFKRDARDGKLKLIECNLRLTAADPMIRAGGLDLPSLLYDRALGRTGPPPGPSRPGMRQWEPSRDIRAFVAYRRAGEITTGAWLQTVAQKNCLPLFSMSDPAPSIGNALASPKRLTSLARSSVSAAMQGADGRVPSTTVLRGTVSPMPRDELQTPTERGLTEAG